MQAAIFVVLFGGLFGGGNKQVVHVYYGAESPVHIGSITMRAPMTSPSMLVCDDGHQARFNAFDRMNEEAERTPVGSKRFDKKEFLARSNRFRRDFPVARGATTLAIPKCAIVWTSGVFMEYPAFTVDLTNSKLPLDVVKDVERRMSGESAADMQDMQAQLVEQEQNKRDLESRRAGVSVTPPQQQTVIPTAPVFVPPALPPMPSVPAPTAPGRTSNVCRTLSNGTIVCS